MKLLCDNFNFELCNDCFTTPTAVYYVFSTIAQSLAAFIGFMVAGYTLVINTIQSQDDSKNDIIEELKKQYYKHLKTLVLFSIITILLCIVIMYLNECIHFSLCIIIIITIALTIYTLIEGVFFIFEIIDPDKLRKTARGLLNKDEQKTTEGVQNPEFMILFVKFESKLRDLWEKYYPQLKVRKDFYQPYISLKTIIDTFFYNEVLFDEERTLIIEIIKIRNLVFHGRVEKIDNKYVSDMTKILEITDLIANRLENRNVNNSNDTTQ